MEPVISRAAIKVTFHNHSKNLEGVCDAYDYHLYLKIPTTHTNPTQKVQCKNDVLNPFEV